MKLKIKNIIQNPLAFGSLIMIGGNMSVNVINYGYHLVMGRLLGPEQYGLLATMYSLLYIVSIIPQSSSVSIVKFISKTESKEQRSSVYLGILDLVEKVSIRGSLLLVVLLPVLKHFLNMSTYWPLIWIIPVYYFSILTVSNQAFLQGVFSFTGTVVTNFISSVAKLLLGLIFIYLGWSVGGAILAVAIAMWLSLQASKRYISPYIKKSKKQKIFETRDFLKYSGPVILQALAFTSIFTVDLLLVKHFFSDFDAGIYAALSTLGKIIFFAASPVTAVMFPVVSKKKANGEPFMRAFLLSLLITTIIAFSLVVFYMLFPVFTVSLLYGNKYIDAAYALPWMGAFIATYTVSQQIVNFYLSIDETRVVFVPLITALLQIILIFLFHDSLLIVIKISFTLVAAIGVILFGKLVYNHRKI